MAVTDRAVRVRWAGAGQRRHHGSRSGRQKRFKSRARVHPRRRRARSARGPRGARGAAPRHAEDRDAYFAPPREGARGARARATETAPRWADDIRTISPETVRASSTTRTGGSGWCARRRSIEPHRRRRSGGRFQREREITDEDRARGERRAEELEARQKRGQRGLVKGEPDEASTQIVKGEEVDAKTGIGENGRATRDAAARRQRGTPSPC